MVQPIVGSLANRELEEKLRDLADGARIEVEGDGRRFIQPASVDDLAEIYAANPDATILAGATDVGLWVTKGMAKLDPVIFVAHLDDLAQISIDDTGITLGAGVTYENGWPALAQVFPDISELMHRLGGEQVRAMGTIGGNIANGSPIGDTPPPFIALDATVTLRQGGDRRTLPLEEFFIEYGKQDRKAGEFVESVFVPRLPETARFRVYKISKRFEEDISAVCGAFRVDIEDGKVASARIAFGGMAGTPHRAKGAETALIGKVWEAAAVEDAVAALADDYAPLTDWRASATYRARSAEGLLRRFLLETTADAPTRLVRERRLAHV